MAGSPIAADTTGATTLYYTEHEHSGVPLWNGRRFVREELALASNGSRETSLSLAGVASGSVYDVFGVRTTRGIGLVLGPAWTSTTARSSVGAITRLEGRRVLKADPRLLYLGSVYGSGSGTVDDSGAAGQRYLWNAYNRVARKFKGVQSSSWTYTSTTIRAANTNTTNGAGRCTFLLGFSEEIVVCDALGYGYNSTTNVQVLCGIGLDQTGGNDADIYCGLAPAGGYASIHHAHFAGSVALGVHYLQAVEASQAFGGTTFHGASSPYIQAGISGEVQA